MKVAVELPRYELRSAVDQRRAGRLCFRWQGQRSRRRLRHSRARPVAGVPLKFVLQLLGDSLLVPAEALLALPAAPPIRGASPVAPHWGVPRRERARGSGGGLDDVATGRGLGNAQGCGQLSLMRGLG